MAQEEFEVASYLQLKSVSDRFRASNLLWENIDKRRWGSQQSTLSDIDKLEIQADHSFSTLEQFFSVISSIIHSLEDASIREILLYGAARRISSIRRAVQQILEIAPVDRKKPLSADEARDLSDSVLLFYVHMSGVFDAFGIALVRKLKPVGVDETKADLFSKKFRAHLNLPELDRAFLERKIWLDRVKQELRNRYVHRIPPYIPPAVFTEVEGQRFQHLEKEKFRLTLAGDFEVAENCGSEQDALGTFSPFITFSESNEQMHLHATVLDDCYRFVCLTYDVLALVLPILDAKYLER